MASERNAINITVSEDEYEFVRFQAYVNRTSMAGYVRQLIQEKSKDTPESKKAAPLAEKVVKVA